MSWTKDAKGKGGGVKGRKQSKKPRVLQTTCGFDLGSGVSGQFSQLAAMIFRQYQGGG